MDETLAKWLQMARGRWCDLIIAGQVFGGRHGEAMQRPAAFQLVGAILVLRFDGPERLVVTEPSGARIGPHGELIIPRAKDVRFGWYYYGSPRRPQNWCERIYRWRGHKVDLTVTGPVQPQSRVFAFSGKECVILG